MVGTNYRVDFVEIHMIWGFCGDKAHVEDLGIRDFTSGGFTNVRAPCFRGNTPLLLDGSLLYEQYG